jgi:hypothetical protein
MYARLDAVQRGGALSLHARILDVAAGEESVAERHRHEELTSEIRRSLTDAMNFFNGRIEFFGFVCSTDRRARLPTAMGPLLLLQLLRPPCLGLLVSRSWRLQSCKRGGRRGGRPFSLY